MTTNLTVLTKATDSPDVFHVYWASGPRKQGLVKVTMACTTESNQIAAELSAVQFLLETEGVCGKDRAGNSLTLTVSFGSIRKLSQGKAEKESLVPYALFLRTRFADAVVEVSKDEGFISKQIAHNHVTQIAVDQPRLSTVKFPDGLVVGITHHALSAYQVRYQVPLAANAWRALRAAISHPRTRLQEVTPEELSRHGKTVNAYVTSEGLRLIVVFEESDARLLTCYYSHHLARQEMHFA